MKIRTLLRAGVAMVFAGSLAACATAQNVATFTNTDLTNGITIATNEAMNSNPLISIPGMEQVQCYTWIQGNLAGITMQLQNNPAPTGLFSGVATADTVANNIVANLSVAQKDAFEVACGPWALHLEGLAASFTAIGIIH